MATEGGEGTIFTTEFESFPRMALYTSRTKLGLGICFGAAQLTIPLRIHIAKIEAARNINAFAT